MANKKISELDIRTSLSLSDLMVVADPTTGYAYKTTITDLKTLTGAGVISFNGRFGAVVPAEGDYSLTQLSDVIITSASNGQVLKFNGTSWVNAAEDTAPVLSVNTKTGAVVLVTDDIAEDGSPVNLWFTNTRARAAISETITGIDYNNSTGVFSLSSGYVIPTTTQETNWTAAYNDKINSAAVTGTTTKTLTLTQQDGGTVTASWTDINTDAVTSVFGRTGAVVATEGDYSLTLLSDVTITTPSNGQVLKYNGTTWVNSADTDTGITSLNGLTALTQTFANDTNVTITSATSTHTIGWSGQLAISRGGTGLSALGTAGQLLRVNTGATALEYFTPTYISGNQTITISGDASGSGTTAITLTLATVNSNVGTFNNVTVNAKGLVTAASNVSYLTANQSITWTAAGDVSGTASGATSVTPSLTVTGLRGVALPTLTAGGGFLKYTGTGTNTWVFDTVTYLTAAITSLNGLTAATQTFSNDTNVTITSATSTHTIGWSGQLAVGRGGTGASTLTGVVIGNGTSAMTAVASTTALQVLRVNSGGTGYEFATISAGGGTPAGSTGQVQFNNAGSFGADSVFFWDNTNKRLGIGTSSPSTLLQVNTARTNGTNVNVLTLSDSLTGVSTPGFGLRIVGTSNTGAVVSAIGLENGGTGTNNESQISFYTQNVAGGLTKQLTIGSAGAATFSSSVTAAGRTRIGGGWIADISGTGNNTGISFGANAVLPADGTGTYTVKDLGSSASPWGTPYFGAGSSDSFIFMNGWNGGQIRILANPGFNTNYNGIQIESNYANSNTLPAWSLDLGGANNALTGGDKFAIGRKASGGSYVNFLNISSTGSTTFSALAGTGTRMVVADASGVLSTQAIPGGGTGSPAGSNGQVQFNSSGSFGADSNFFWDNTNKRLGVGTSSPSYLLDVAGSGRFSGLRTESSLTSLTAVNTSTFYYMQYNTDGLDAYTNTNAAAPIYFKTGGSTKLTIADNGAATFSSSVTATAGLTIGSLTSGSNAVLTLATNASGSPRSISYRAATADITIDSTAGSALMTITNGGNVGIGISSPSALTEIRVNTNDYGNNLILSNTSPNNNIGTSLSFGHNTQALDPDILARISGYVDDRTNANRYGSLRFYTATGGTLSERMRIKSTGQLQFNNYQATTSFTGTLVGYLGFDASGNVLTTGTPTPTAAGLDGYVQFNGDSVLDSDSNFFWDNTNKRLGLGNSTPSYRLDVSGQMRATTGLIETRIDPRSITTTSTATLTPDVSADDVFILTGQTATLTLANPTGTPVDGQKIIVRIFNTTGQTINYGTQYRASSDFPLPTTTTSNRTIYLGFIYNSTDTKWDLIAKLDNFA
jgi:hypothetical protein